MDEAKKKLLEKREKVAKLIEMAEKYPYVKEYMKIPEVPKKEDDGKKKKKKNESEATVAAPTPSPAAGDAKAATKKEKKEKKPAATATEKTLKK